MRNKTVGNKMITTGCVILCLLTMFAVFVPAFSGQSYSDQNAAMQNLGSSSEHWLGTDKFGRDIFTRIWYAMRISLLTGLGSAAICGVFGTLYGAVSGYAGGRLDMFLMRVADVIDAIPSLLYIILIRLAFGGNVWCVLSGICISGWIEPARLVRGEVLRLKQKTFCPASRLAGAGDGRILWKHILPNAAGPLIVNLTFFAPKAILTEAFLSFLGVGISAPAASLGTLIQEARSQMRIYPSQMLYPVLALCLLTVSFHLIGTGLEEVQRMKQGA